MLSKVMETLSGRDDLKLENLAPSPILISHGAKGLDSGSNTYEARILATELSSQVSRCGFKFLYTR